MYESIGGNKRIGGTFCSKLINEESQISAYRWDFFLFSNKRPVRLFGTLEYMYHKLLQGILSARLLTGYLQRILEILNGILSNKMDIM